MPWIKCSEQLPDKDQYVLTYNITNSRCPQMGFYSTMHGEWRMINVKPTHWCEWPELPKKD